MLSRSRLLIIIASAGVHSGCTGPSKPAQSIAQIERRILEAAPTGWTLVSRSSNATPYGHADAGKRGKLMVLRGPTKILLRGYYCGRGAFCSAPIIADEALKIWIMPPDYADHGVGLAPPQGRVAEPVLSNHQVYALVSRYGGPTLDFDGGFTDASTETSPLPAAPHGELPLSWSTWREDITTKLEGDAR
jgi:hypothetical protein